MGDARERHAVRAGPAGPARFLTERAHLLPSAGRALDVAGGGGRNAVWLAQHGLDVTLVDVSDEACRQATDRAAAAGVPLTVRRLDLETDPPPAGPWDLVVFHHYLDRALVRALWTALRPGGLLLVCQPTVRNLERHPRPSRRWLLAEGELAELARRLPDAEVLQLAEGWTDEGRHEARLVARAYRPDADPGGRR
jgi:tellurite methyltransferase